MGEESRRKWQAKIEAARLEGSKSAVQVVQKLDSESTPIKWAAKMGVAAFAIGIFSQLPFLYSVGAVYLGTILCGIDLWITRFPNHQWFKYLMTVVLLCGSAAFTKIYVLREDPIRVVYRGYADLSPDAQGILNVFVSNETDADYRDVDFRIELPKENYVVQAQQTSSLATCTVFKMDETIGHGGETALLTWKDNDKANAKMQGAAFQRVRCEELPHDSVLKIALEIRLGVNKVVPAGGPEKVSITGNYKGKYRTFALPEEATRE